MINKKKYQVFHPDHETRANFFYGMDKAINSENFSELFRKAGFLNKSADDWILLQTALDIFNEMEERGGVGLDFVAIGIRIAVDGIFPAEFEQLSFEQKLVNLTDTYTYFHRGTDIGASTVKQHTSQHLAYHSRTPFPDDQAYGIIYGLAKRFLPSDMAFKVYYDPQKPRRELGGEETIIHVEWWEKDSK